MGLRVKKDHGGFLVHRELQPDNTYESIGKYQIISAARPQSGATIVRMQCSVCGRTMQFKVHSISSTWRRRFMKLVPFTLLLIIQIWLVNLSLEEGSMPDMLRALFFAIMVFVQVIMLALLFTGQGLTHLCSVRHDDTIDVNVYGHQLR